MKWIMMFLKEEEGLEKTEYALLCALLCLSIVSVMEALSTEIVGSFSRIVELLSR